MSRPYRTLTYVVGHSRGGTTWLGELLGCHPASRSIFEPFASQAHPCTGIDMQTVFNGGRFILRGKRGRPVPDIPIPRFFRTAAVDPSADRLSRLAAMHVEELARESFPGEAGYHLIIKQPRIENIGWASAAIAADQVVALDRHPLGVVNSVRRWGMLKWTRIEWALVGRDETLSRAARSLVTSAETPEERLLALTWLRSQHMREFVAASPSAILVEYDALCVDPVGESVRIWRHVGLPADAAARAALESLVAKRDGPGEDRGSRFLHVHKDPLARQHAWRHELPDSIRRRLERFIRRHGLAIPLPGDGLPVLSATERMLAAQADALAIGTHIKRFAAAVGRRGRREAA
jgi:hypothetical protein